MKLAETIIRDGSKHGMVEASSAVQA